MAIALLNTRSMQGRTTSVGIYLGLLRPRDQPSLLHNIDLRVDLFTKTKSVVDTKLLRHIATPRKHANTDNNSCHSSGHKSQGNLCISDSFQYDQIDHHLIG